MHADGTYVGRAAPEIDVIEAIVTDGVGMVCHVSHAVTLPHNLSRARFPHNLDHSMQVPTQNVYYQTLV
jgi:hypothetical protein